ncbi:MAG: hypothetical protein U5K55_14675 [Aliarcobacter sp.]|nr:hypothetical protein [Aliarcobacter sp.]
MEKINEMIREDIDKLIKSKRIKCSQNTNEEIIFRNINFNQHFNFTDNILKIDKTDISNFLYDRNNNQIDISGIKEVIFENCSFNYLPTINNTNIWLIRFAKCTINDCQSIVSLLKQNNINKKVYFNNCTLDDLSFGDIRDIKYNSNIELCYFQINGGSIRNLTIENIELVSKLYFNRNNDAPMIIDNLKIKGSIFKENFKLHKCEVKKVSISDSDFEKQFDCYGSTFIQGCNDTDKTIYFKTLNIKGLFIFDSVTFNQKVKFEYVTFESSGNFRYSTFKKGLDLDSTNIQEDKIINFHGVQELDKKSSIIETSQETYRIIKHNFEKLGNKIESNKFHSLELNANRRELWSSCESGLCERKIVSLFHFISSNHSQSWIISLVWIFIISLITSLLLCDTFNNWHYKAEYLSILAEIKLSDKPWIFLFHKVSLGYLYYQFLTAVRKDTRK